MKKTTFHLLILDDSKEIRESLSAWLNRNGFKTDTAASPADARQLMAQHSFDLLLLDIMMPGEDGLSFFKSLGVSHELPVIFLSALHSDANKIRGLELGADDYVTKPFNPRELLARIHAVLRRTHPQPDASPPPQLLSRRIANFLHNPEAQLLCDSEGNEILLTTGENRVLTAMLEAPGRIFNRDDIALIMRGPKAEASPRAADNCVSRLRRKLGDNARAPRLIVTEWGGGYRIPSGALKAL